MAKDTDDTTDLNKKLDNLVNVVGKLATGLKATQDSIAALQPSSPKGGKKGSDDDEEEFSLDGIDLERLSRAEFLGVISKSFRSDLTKLLKPFQEQINELNTRQTRSSVEAQVKELLADKKNADFSDWAEELKAKLKANPNMSVKEALILVRAEDPVKTQDLRKKYKLDEDEDGDNKNNKNNKNLKNKPKKETFTKDDEDDEDDDDDDKTVKGKKPGFGGLPPGSGGGDRTKGGKAGKTNEMVAEEAFEDVASRHDDIEAYIK